MLNGQRTQPRDDSWRKSRYDTYPHTRAALDVMRAVALNGEDRQEIKRTEAAFLDEDVANFDPEFHKKIHALMAQLKGKQ